MYGHIVPQAYLKKWIVEGTKSQLKVCYKNQDGWKEKNIGNFGGQSNYYILPLFDHNGQKDIDWFSRLDYRINIYQVTFPAFFESVYDEILNQYEITLDSETLGKADCGKILKHFDSADLEIKQNGYMVKKGPIREKITRIWKEQQYSDYLEGHLGRIETNWEKAVDAVIDKTNTEEHFLPQFNFNEIIQFISIQQARLREYSIVKNAIMKTEDIVSDLMREIIPDGIKFTDDDNITIWMIQLLLYFSKSNDNMVDRLVANNGQSTIFIIKAKEGSFITSDNPITRYKCSPTGILIIYPVSPKVCLCLGKGKEVRIPMVKQFNIMEANKTIVSYINNVIYQHANECIISNNEDYTYSEMPKPCMELFNMWAQIDYFSPM